ncbi:MAG: hypothetical protein R3B45_05260 [Bdellovibrionota bacterium]
MGRSYNFNASYLPTFTLIGIYSQCSRLCQLATRIIQKSRLYFYRVDHRPVPLADLVYFAVWLLPEAIPTKSLQHGKSPTSALSHESLIQRLTPLVNMGLTPTIIYMGSAYHISFLQKNSVEIFHR